MRHFHVLSIAILMLLLASGLLVGRARAQEISLFDVLPAAADIGAGFEVIEDRPRSLEEQATGFSDAARAAQLLAGWSWQENALQRFASDTETVDISATRFASADGAAQALPFFLDDRAAILGQNESQSIVPIGDEARAVNGFYNGLYDYTLYVRSGPLLLRISAASGTGSPHASPEAIAQGIIDRAAGSFGEQSAPAEAEATAQQSANVVLPESLPLSGIACAPVADDADVLSRMERFDGIANARSTLPAMGWLEGAGREFGCDAPSSGHVGWVSLSVHRFNDPGAAEGAVYSFADSRSLVTNLQFAAPLALGDSAAALSGPTVNGTEYTLFLSRGDLLFRVTGVAPSGSPQVDVESIAADLYAQNTGEMPEIAPTVAPVPTQAPAIAAPTIAPLAPAPVPTLTPVPTLAPLPTSTPIPTVAPLPTATPRPAIVAPPTSTPVPAAPAAPTTIAVQIPTAIPTAPSGGAPTPTPRVINPPTPVGE